MAQEERARLFFGLIVGLAIMAVFAVLVTGCAFDLGGTVKEMAPGADSSFVKMTGMDARGAEEVTGAVGAKLDAGDESNEATQGDTTITGEGATVYNIQAVGGSAMLLMIAALGAGLYLARKKGAVVEAAKDNTTEALDRVMAALRKDPAGEQIGQKIHEAGCRTHPTRGEIHDDAEAVIRERLQLIKRPGG